MTHLSKAFSLLALVALAACANPDRFGGNTVDLNQQNGIDSSMLDSASINSPAYFSQTIGDRVLFEVDQSTLNPTARQVLEGQAIWLLDNRDYQIVIEGHADEQGTREYNLALGARRASAVQQFLIAQGVRPDRIRTVTYGKERPIEICSEESCYAKNRRAVTVLNAGAIS
jgi:peptidoglycan-associated lipoprotein